MPLKRWEDRLVTRGLQVVDEMFEKTLEKRRVTVQVAQKAFAN